MTEPLGMLNPCGGGDPIPLLKETLLIGRRSHCDISLKFKNVSSHHCELTFEHGYWKVTDLNSSNGVKVNGERCETKWLMPGDTLAIAKHAYELDYQPLSDGPPPADDDADVFSMSLMERAGLEPRRPRPHRPASVEKPPRKAADSAADSDEDLAVGFLNDPDA